jgi:hypothetical protein
MTTVVNWFRLTNVIFSEALKEDVANRGQMLTKTGLDLGNQRKSPKGAEIVTNEGNRRK